MSQPPPTQPNPGAPPSGPPPPGMQQQNDMKPSQQQRMMPPQYQQMGMQQQPGQYPMVPGYAPTMPMMNPGMPMTNPTGMPPPPPPPPLGLSVLSTISQVFIKQRADMMEMMSGWDTNNRYDIVTPDGGCLFYCQEMSDAFSRQVFGANRAFNIGIMDGYGRQVIQLVRGGVSIGFVPPPLQVMSPPGTIIGNVNPDGGFSTRFMVSAGGEALIIQGPNVCCPCSFAGVNEFVVETSDGKEIGKISKLWSGYMQEAYTNADNFGISFPVDLSLEMKAVLIGAAILIDFQYYERQPNHDRHGHRRHTF